MKTIDKVNNILSKNNINLKLNEKNITMNMKELGVDSIAVMSIIVEIENEFKITLDDNKLINLKTAKDLIDAIEDSLKK